MSEPVPPSTPLPLPLADLARFLEERGVELWPDDYARLRRLLAAGGGWTRAALADGIAALLATSPVQLAALRRALREYLGVDAAAEAAEKGDEGADIDVPQALDELKRLGGGRSPAMSAPLIAPPDVFAQAAAKVAQKARRRLWVLGAALVSLLGAALSALAVLPLLRAGDDAGALLAGETLDLDVLKNDAWPLLGEPRLEVGKAGLGEVAVGVDRKLHYTAKAAGKESFAYELIHWSGRRRATVSLEVGEQTPPPPPQVPDVPAPRERRYPHAVKIAQVRVLPAEPPGWSMPELIAAATLMLTSFLLAFYFVVARRFAKAEPLPFDDSLARRFSPGVVGGARPAWLSLDTLERLTACLRYQALEEPTSTLDMTRTVAATTRGLQPELIFELRRETMKVLLLVDEQARDLEWNPLPLELERGLRARGAQVERALFRGSLNDLFERTPHRLYLPDLEGERVHLLILLLTDGKGMRRPDLARLRQLAGWPNVAWLDPREPRFWDSSVMPATLAGLELRPLDPASLLEVFTRLLGGGGVSSGLRLAELRRQGLLVERRQELRADLAAVLGSAAPWAQACAMLQPMPLALAERLRTRFFADLPAHALGRLLGLPASTWTKDGIVFGDSALALLRRDFATFHLPASQDAILQFLLAAIDAVEPLEPRHLPGLAHLGWQLHREKLRLEIDPDDALAQLRLLAATPPLEAAVQADLGPLVLPRQGRPAADLSDFARIPLRLSPETEQGRHDLARLAPEAGLEKKLRREPKPWQRYLIGVSALLSLGLAAHAWYRFLTAQDPQPGWKLKFLLPETTDDQHRALAGAAFAIQVATAGESGMGGFVQPRIFYSPTGVLRELVRDEAMLANKGDQLEMAVLMDGFEQRTPVGPLPGEAGVLEIEMAQADEVQPCNQGSELYRLELCPALGEPTSDPAPARASGTTLAILITFGSSPTAEVLGDAMLATKAVDRVYQIMPGDGGADTVRTVLDSLGPWSTNTRMYWIASEAGAPAASSGGTAPTRSRTVQFGGGDPLKEGDGQMITLPFDRLDDEALGLLEQASYSLELPDAFLDRLRENLRPAATSAPEPGGEPVAGTGGEPSSSVAEPDPASSETSGYRSRLAEGPGEGIGAWAAEQLLAAAYEQGAQVALVETLRFANAQQSGPQEDTELWWVVTMVSAELERLVGKTMATPGSTLHSAGLAYRTDTTGQLQGLCLLNSSSNRLGVEFLGRRDAPLMVVLKPDLAQQVNFIGRVGIVRWDLKRALDQLGSAFQFGRELSATDAERCLQAERRATQATGE